MIYKIQQEQNLLNEDDVVSMTDISSINDFESGNSIETLSLMNNYDIDAMFDPSELTLQELKFLLPMIKQKTGFNVTSLLLMSSLTENEKRICNENNLRYNLQPELDENWLNHMLLKGAWNKYLDPKRRNHFFHNVHTGESTWDIPRWSKYFNVYRRECRQNVALRDKKIKIITISKTQFKKRELAEQKKKRRKKIGLGF